MNIETVDEREGSGSCIDTFCRETRHKTLEEIAAAFGDKVVEIGDREMEAETSEQEEKADTRHVETKANV